MTTGLVGVLGGMGPAAGVSFCARLVELTPSTVDQEHLPFMLWSDPSVPDRTEALLHNGPSVIPALENGMRQLKSAGASFLAIPCNTAHIWASDIAERVEISLLSIVGTSVAHADEVTSPGGTVAVLGTAATISSGIYQKGLKNAGLRALVPTPESQAELIQAIYMVKTGGEKSRHQAAQLVQQICDSLEKRGAQAIISGCTEIALLADLLNISIPFIDSVDALARATVHRARA